MRLRRNEGLRFARTWIGVASLSLVLRAHAADYRTTAFNARLKIGTDRVLTVDETIEIVPGPSGKLESLVLADAPAGTKKLQYLVTRASISSGDKTAPVTVTPNADNQLVTSLAADAAKGPIKLHVNYMVLGAFRDRSGGSLGNRATMSWNIVPASWPTAVESGLLDIEYPAHSVPLYVGADSGSGADKLSIEKTPNTAFKGNTDALNVSEVSGGVTMQPQSGLAANAGLHLLIAIAKGDLKPAPKKLSLPAADTSQPNSPKPANADSHKQPAVSSPKHQEKTPQPKEQSLWPILLPLAPPVLLFLWAFKRLSFLRSRGLPTSAVPAGIGPAEAGYLLEGSLKPRHVLGALASLPELSKPGSATIDPSSLGPVERRMTDILHEKGSDMSPKDLRTAINGSLQELQGLVVHNLASQELLYPTAKRGKLAPSLVFIAGIAICGGFAVYLDPTRGGLFSALGAVLGGIFIYSLSPLTQKGIKVHRRVDGLNRFLAANAQEFRTEKEDTYLESLRPIAIAFGLASDGFSG